MTCGDDFVIGGGKESKSPATGVRVNWGMLCRGGIDGTAGAAELYLRQVLRKLL